MALRPAQIGAALHAQPAMAAGNGRLDANQTPIFRQGRCLVPQHVGRFQLALGNSTVGIPVQIGPANADCLNVEK